MKDREIELRQRAMAILGVTSAYDRKHIRSNFLRQIRLVHPDGPHRADHTVPGFNNADVARLLIQAYSYLIGRPAPTTMIENDALVGILLDGDITPMAETTTYEGWHANQFFDQFQKSIWPESPEGERQLRYKFKGL